MDNVVVLAQLFAVFYFSLLFEGLHDKIYGIKKRSKEDAEKEFYDLYYNSTIATWSDDNSNDLYRREELINIIEVIHKKGTKFIKRTSLVGFLMCIGLISYSAYVDLLRLNSHFIYMLHPVLLIPGLLCCVYYKHYTTSARKVTKDVTEKLNNRIRILNTNVNKIIIDPDIKNQNSENLLDHLADIKDNEYVNTYIKEFSNSHRQIDAATKTAFILFKNTIDGIITDYKLITDNNCPFKLSL